MLTIHCKHLPVIETLKKWFAGPLTEFDSDCVTYTENNFKVDVEDLSPEELAEWVRLELDVCRLEEGIDVDLFV